MSNGLPPGFEVEDLPALPEGFNVDGAPQPRRRLNGSSLRACLAHSPR